MEAGDFADRMAINLTLFLSAVGTKKFLWMPEMLLFMLAVVVIALFPFVHPGGICVHSERGITQSPVFDLLGSIPHFLLHSFVCGW